MSILCTLFGHPMQAPYFTDDGRWHSECARGDLKLDGLIPPQHQHVYGRKVKREGYYIYQCECGNWIDAPAPVKRAKKEIS